MNDIDCGIVSEELLREVFGITEPVDTVLSELVSSDQQHLAVLLEHQVIRRSYEVDAKKNNYRTIGYGLHGTDIIAGVLNSYITGRTLDKFVKKETGEFTLIYPLAFLLKKEIHHYYRAVLGKTPLYACYSLEKGSTGQRIL